MRWFEIPSDDGNLRLLILANIIPFTVTFPAHWKLFAYLNGIVSVEQKAIMLGRWESFIGIRIHISRVHLFMILIQIPDPTQLVDGY